MRPKWLATTVIAVLPLAVGNATRADDRKPPASSGVLKFTGRVEAAASVGLPSRVAGVVDKVHVDIGDRVKKGQLLVELSAPELNDDVELAAARVEQAKAQVEQARAATQAAKARFAQAEAAQEAVRAAVTRARVGLEQAQADADRVRKLAENAAVSKEELDAHLHQADAAKAAVEEAEAQVKTAQAGRNSVAAEVSQTEAGIRAAEAGVAVAQAALRRAESQLECTRIVAPFDGFVSRRMVDAGTTLGPPKQGESAPLVTLMRDDVVHVIFEVDERSAARVAVGGPAVIHAPALGDAEFTGKVTRTAAAFNPETGTLRAEIDLPNADGKLRPGMFVTVEVTEERPGK